MTSRKYNGNVQTMNKKIITPPLVADHFRSLQILDELAANDSVTQRDLSERLGIALGLVNSYIKNLVTKGFITIKTIPRKRYAYFLTPQGFAEKTRLAYDLLHDYTRIYREAKSNYRTLFSNLEQSGETKIIFAGADEVAEIAYITLHETRLELIGVVDNEKKGSTFFGREVMEIASCKTLEHDCVIITSYLKHESIAQTLIESGIAPKSIRQVFAS